MRQEDEVEDPSEDDEVLDIAPKDAFNEELLRLTHPADWSNPTPQGRYNLVVIGGGTAGLIAALGGAGLGGRVALIEKALMGGDCLNWGCVPSKALMRALEGTQPQFRQS
ncbi:MAG: FAD-dependent oxidoreductase, partial [Myxococcota bacterium]